MEALTVENSRGGFGKKMKGGTSRVDVLFLKFREGGPVPVLKNPGMGWAFVHPG